MFRSLILASAVFFVFTCAAQTTGSGAPTSSAPAKPTAQTQATVPASTTVKEPVPTPGSAAPKNQESDKDQPKKKAKRVWTNEEISTVGGNVSVVGDPSSSDNSYQGRRVSSASDNRDVAWYRNQLAPLRSQINDINRQIEKWRSTKGTVRENVESQVQLLETKREKIQAKIDELEEDARHHGVEPGDLR